MHLHISPRRRLRRFLRATVIVYDKPTNVVKVTLVQILKSGKLWAFYGEDEMLTKVPSVPMIPPDRFFLIPEDDCFCQSFNEAHHVTARQELPGLGGIG
jgi:hypothetical protein